MSIAQKLIEDVKERDEETRKEYQATIDAKKAEMIQNCKTWIADLVDDLNPAYECARFPSQDIRNMRIYLPINFQEIEGEIISNGHGLAVKFKFPRYRNHPTELYRSFNAPIKSEEWYASWGRLFAEALEKKKAIRKQNQEEEEKHLKRESDQRRTHYENQLQWATQEEDIIKMIEEAKIELPDVANWDEIGQDCIEKNRQRTEEARKQIEKEERNKRRYQEKQEEAQKFAEEAWHPFVLYRIDHVAYVGSEEEPFYLDSAYALNDQPLNGDWWDCPKKGEIIKRKFPNILSITEVPVRTPEDIPPFHSTYGYVCQIRHDHGVKIYFPPEGARRL